MAPSNLTSAGPPAEPPPGPAPPPRAQRLDSADLSERGVNRRLSELQMNIYALPAFATLPVNFFLTIYLQDYYERVRTCVPGTRGYI